MGKNRIDQVFGKKSDILNIYFTAGYPNIDDTIRVAESLQEAGADMLEIGMPFSDPLADGPTIQQSSQQSLDQGMTIELLFQQLKGLRKHVSIPVLLMGYVNPIMQFGIKRFCDECAEVGIDGVIIPDLPMNEYLEEYKQYFDQKNIHNIFLISPNTADERIRLIDEKSGGFIYVVSSSSITGAKQGIQDGQVAYYNKIKNMELDQPLLIGFGISNHETFSAACDHANGAIIGSAFVNQLREDASDVAIKHFIKGIKEST